MLDIQGPLAVVWLQPELICTDPLNPLPPESEQLFLRFVHLRIKHGQQMAHSSDEEESVVSRLTTNPGQSQQAYVYIFAGH
jgi:hypothetical protein